VRRDDKLAPHEQRPSRIQVNFRLFFVLGVGLVLVGIFLGIGPAWLGSRAGEAAVRNQARSRGRGLSAGVLSRQRVLKSSEK
jgi:hypothetical protein